MSSKLKSIEDFKKEDSTTTSKTIDTLVEDIESLLSSGIEDIPEKAFKNFTKGIASSIIDSLGKRERKATLRMSNIGRPCERQLWYEVNKPELSSELRPENYMKFMYGHLVEELLLFLAELAGHEVTGRQDEQEIEDIKGHRDAIIDGVLVDVKSASSYSFKKFKEGRLLEDDPFGYSDQLQSYLYAAKDDPIVTDKEQAAFLVVDKTLGHTTLDVHKKNNKDYERIYREKKEMVQKSTPPKRAFTSKPFGKSGNETLQTICSYCPFKKTCWPELRQFLYSTGPVDLVVVNKMPLVPEIINGELIPPGVEREVTNT